MSPSINTAKAEVGAAERKAAAPTPTGERATAVSHPYETHVPPPSGASAKAQPVWLTTDEAAAHIGAARKTLEAWRRVGGGPRYALAGRRRMYRVDWLDAWLESRSVTSNAEARRAGWR
ncbi:MAG: helix-turn-helix domain-containing protein [Hyphomicrobiaceae bacterium]|nr:helix-turn-helix domain-containing protein [Hyphomicrobiaceae bacterium]